MVIQSSLAKKPKLFLDTNIIIYRAQVWTNDQIKKELTRLETNYTLVISKMSRYEIIKSKNVELSRENEILKLLNLFESFDITEDLLITAALLSRMFFPNMNSEDKQRKDVDLIIAATAVLSKSLLLTVNRSDFPYPYFKEIEVSPILYKRIPEKTDCILLFLLQPNIKEINNEVSKISTNS